MTVLAEPRSETFEDRMLRVGENLRIHVRDYPAAAPETGAPVICLHGLTRNVADFELVAPRIAALGRRVIAMSMRGRGRSDRDPDPANYTPPVYVQDVLQALDMLGAQRAVFLGTSMGGIITMLLAAGAPDRVAAAILNDIGPVLDPRGLARIAGYVGRGQPVADWEAAADAIAAINGPAFPNERDNREFWRTFARRTFRAHEGKVETDYDPMIALAFADPPAAPADLSPVFQALAPKPVLVVRGAISDLLSEEGVAGMRALKPDLHVALVPNVGHAPTLEEPEAWDAILDFLARTP